MKQIFQHLRTGKMELADVPCPAVGPGMVLIQTRRSVISPGTERMLIEFSKGNLLQKARTQPERVRQVLDKMQTDGVLPTLEAVFRKLDEPLPLGYCNAGVVLEVGEGVDDLLPGDRVISNGAHAEIVCVPRNLCSPIPDGVADEAAAFTVLGSIALQGVRLASPTLGERFVVFGCGVLGLLTIQLLRAHGCGVMAIDVDSDRLALAEQFGARIADLSAGTDPVKRARTWTGDAGVDGAIITASAKSDKIVHQAAQACRKRGRIVLVGVVGLNLQRSDFYEKELSFQVSCSYGPGRYDESYEQKGQDYPVGYVRWTEQRNFQAVLDVIATGTLNVEPLITHRFDFRRALAAYEAIEKDRSALGVILEYRPEVDRSQGVRVAQIPSRKVSRPVVGVIGAGSFARAVLIPAIEKQQSRLAYVAGRSKTGSLHHAAQRFGAENAVTDYRTVLEDRNVDAVFIVTGHHSHARLVCEALEARKHVLVEKPLAISEEQLKQVRESVLAHPELQLMVGYNRRFSPHTRKASQLLRGRVEPLCMSMTINAGEISRDHWIQDAQRGGGRIIGEACHFIDLMVYLTGSLVRDVQSVCVGPGPAVRTDKAALLLSFEDGSIGTINYFANGSKRYPKETLEVFSEGRVLRIDNFRETSGYGFTAFKRMRTVRQDKGHRAEVAAFLERVEQGGKPLIPFVELENVSAACFRAARMAADSRESQGS